ncbi:MAG: hypothetical protein ABR592_09420 [Nitriliruptorales bacterium]
MKDPFSRYVETATQLTRDTAERIVRGILKQGDVGRAHTHEFADAGERSGESREGVVDLVRSETKRVISAMGLATRDDVERLEQQIADLRQLITAEQAAGSVTGETPSGTREIAKKTAARRTAMRADSGDAPIPETTTAETARRVATAPEATTTAAERTRPPGEAVGSRESPPVQQPSVVDVENPGTASSSEAAAQEGEE